MPLRWHTVPAFLLLPVCISAVTLDCEHIRIDKRDFNLKPLAGPKTVHWQQWLPPTISNTTFTIDLCDPIKRKSDVEKAEQCPTGTRVCAVDEHFNTVEGTRQIDEVKAIAGEFSASHGRSLEPKVERLKDSSNDAKLEGLRIELHGGKYPDTRQGLLQKAIIELHCDAEVTGNEGFEDEKKMMDVRSLARRADDDDEGDAGPELPDLDKDKSLQFVSYKQEGKDEEFGVLRLTWKTKYACENAKDLPSDGDGEKKSSGGWGFFTWFIIILFLLAAAYIIFGSWLNYNRYGARGWDLIPHGDTIRDIPYIVKEWAGDMVDRMRGSGGSRGGYSAV
jgi:autophagy-related protein 27